LVLKYILVVNCKNLIWIKQGFDFKLPLKKFSIEDFKISEVKHFSNLNKKSNEMMLVVASENVF